MRPKVTPVADLIDRRRALPSGINCSAGGLRLSKCHVSSENGLPLTVCTLLLTLSLTGLSVLGILHQ